MLVGVDIGGTNMKLGLVNKQGEIVKNLAYKTNVASLNQYEIARELGKNLQEFIKGEEIRAIGIGAPGIVDDEAGVLIYAANLNIDHLDLRQILKEYINEDVALINDANAAALAESRYGASQGKRSSFLITIGTGIGGGLVINDQIYTGFNGAGVEPGHTCIAYAGAHCSCGRRGCLEAYTAAPALIKQIESCLKLHPDNIMHDLIAEREDQDVSTRVAFEALRRRDPVAIDLMSRYFDYLAEGMANVINNYLPEMIVFGGGVSYEGDDLILPVKRRALELAFLPAGMSKPEFKRAVLGNDAGIIGAAAYAEDALNA